MVPHVDAKGLGELAGAGAKFPDIVRTPSRFHHADSARRLNRPDKDQPVPWSAFYEHVQHPMDAVVQINVGGARLVPRDEGAGAGPIEAMTRLIVFGEIRLCLDDDACASAPDQLGADQRTPANKRIGLEE